MIQDFWKPAVKVHAVQFTNQLGNTLAIFEWLGGCFYVEKGADSEHRELSELGGEGQSVSSDAPPFLIIKTRFGESRVDIGDWIVKLADEPDHISTYSDLDFKYQFQKEQVKGE